MIGDGLVAAGYLSQEQKDDVLARQAAGDKRRFGEIAIAAGYLDDATMMQYLELWASGKVDDADDEPSTPAS